MVKQSSGETSEVIPQNGETGLVVSILSGGHFVIGKIFFLNAARFLSSAEKSRGKLGKGRGDKAEKANQKARQQKSLLT